MPLGIGVGGVEHRVGRHDERPGEVIVNNRPRVRAATSGDNRQWTFDAANNRRSSRIPTTRTLVRPVRPFLHHVHLPHPFQHLRISSSRRLEGRRRTAMRMRGPHLVVSAAASAFGMRVCWGDRRCFFDRVESRGGRWMRVSKVKWLTLPCIAATSVQKRCLGESDPPAVGPTHGGGRRVGMLVGVDKRGGACW